jgi:hypothetical protein
MNKDGRRKTRFNMYTVAQLVIAKFNSCYMDVYMYTQTSIVTKKKKHLKKLKKINPQIYNIFIQVLQEVNDLCYVI